MKTSTLTALLAAAFTRQTIAQLATTITDDANGKSIYVPVAGSTSSVAAPAATPTLIYNCNQMPLICENVAAWVKGGGGGGSSTGDLAGNQLFYFDPEPGQKDSRRTSACGCFDHDSCVGSGKSNGKSSGSLVVDIATSTLGNAISAIAPAASPIILAGANPKSGGIRMPVNAIPGRFFQDGVGLTCDEFPAATFIEGGSGAKTICAMQSWQVYQGDPNNWSGNPGKWPLPKNSGNRQEQDWQASVHVALRKVLGIGSTKKRTGFNTVYPFLFSTTTTANAGSKAWVQAPNTMPVITKRDAPATTVELVPRVTTIVVTGDDEIDRKNPYLGRLEVRKAAPGMQNSPREFEARATSRPHPRNLDYSPRGAAPAPTAAPESLFARGSNPGCDTDFEKQGLEDTEVGDPGFDDDLPQDESKPDCSGGIPAPQSDVQAINGDLDSWGNDGYGFDNCCGGGTFQCSQVDTWGKANIALCGAQPACIGCAQLANYVEGLINTCTTNGQTQGKQVINEAPGLTVVIGLNDT